MISVYNWKIIINDLYIPDLNKSFSVEFIYLEQFKIFEKIKISLRNVSNSDIVVFNTKDYCAITTREIVNLVKEKIKIYLLL